MASDSAAHSLALAREALATARGRVTMSLSLVQRSMQTLGMSPPAEVEVARNVAGELVRALGDYVKKPREPELSRLRAALDRTDVAMREARVPPDEESGDYAMLHNALVRLRAHSAQYIEHEAEVSQLDRDAER